MHFGVPNPFFRYQYYNDYCKLVRGAKTISKATNRTTNDRLEAEQPTQLRKGSRDF